MVVRAVRLLLGSGSATLCLSLTLTSVTLVSDSVSDSHNDSGSDSDSGSVSVTVYIETGRRPNRPPIGGSGRLLFPTAGAAGGARFVYTAAAVLYTHYTASTNYLPLMSSQFDCHCHWH